MSAEPFESCVRQSDFSPKQLLASEFCSLWWIAASHVRRRDRHGRVMVCRKRGAYPVGGMVKCSACGRWAPSDWGRDMCADCRVEADVTCFQERLAGLARADHVELLRVYWRRPVRVVDWIKEGMKAPESGSDDTSVNLKDDREGDALFSEVGLPNGFLESDQKWGNAPNSRKALNRLRRRFLEPYVTAEGEKRRRVKRRGMGSQVILLPESDEALMAEVAYYKATGAIVPSALRVNNPFDRGVRQRSVPGRPCGP